MSPAADPHPLPARAPTRIRVEGLAPAVACGRWPVKRTIGEAIELSAEVIRDGHEVLRAELRWQRPGATGWEAAPMRPVDAQMAGVRWAGVLDLDALGPWRWGVRAWADDLASWRLELAGKVDAGQGDLAGELAEGAGLLVAAARRAHGEDRDAITAAAAVVADAGAATDARVACALDPSVAQAADRHPDRSQATTVTTPAPIDVDPELARFGAWYELFPRSWGGLDGIRRRLPALAELGFDVIYLPPIHPIGATNRKGRDNALVAGPGDPGSPWAIGDATGDHTAVHPDLGTVDDVEALVAEARALGMEVALDFAIQCSADHPWLTEHPEWFHGRPDGTLKYAENPPKRYEDIYNVDFDCADWRGLWTALRDVVRFWVACGVRVFRVDNPHTKPLPFWQWLIASIRATDPDVVFLAEAFTRRAMMQELARIGFSQSYTYFTWKSSRWELTEYVGELAASGEQQYFRPNFFVNTPDILTDELQRGGPAAFASRLVLAATLSPSYGIYSGYEHFEAVAVRPGSEEYLDSEKYEVKARTLDGPLLALVTQLNRIRRQNPALQHLDNITFLDSGNDQLLAYAKRTGDNVLLCIVLLDPHTAQEGLAVVPPELGLPGTFEVRDLLSDERFGWQVGGNYVRLVPGLRPAHILSVQPA